MVRSKDEIRPDSDLAPEPVAELGEIARVNATGKPPEGPAKEPLLGVAGKEDATSSDAGTEQPF